MHAAEGPQRVDRAVSSPLSIISLGDVGGDGGVTDRATRGACSAGSGIVSCTTSLGLRSLSQHPVTVSGLRGVRYILARHTRRSHTDCNPEARAYAHLAGPRHDGGTDWHAHVPQWWPMVLCTLPPHVGKPLPTYVGPAFPGASSCLKHPTDRQACLVFLYSTLSFPL